MRWRDIKKQQTPTSLPEKTTHSFVPINMRIRAFITDMFMIYIPILYILTYLVLDGKEDFQASQWAPFLGVTLYALIDATFTTKTGQSPGKKAYEIKVIDARTKENLSFVRALWRFTLFIITAATIFALLVPFFRQDRKALHDILSRTTLIKSN